MAGMENTTTSPTAAAPEPAPEPASGKNSIAETTETTTEPTRAGTRLTSPERGGPSNGRVLDLVALVVLIALAAVVFTVAGPPPTMFTAVTSVGLGLFATWRSTHFRPPGR